MCANDSRTTEEYGNDYDADCLLAAAAIYADPVRFRAAAIALKKLREERQEQEPLIEEILDDYMGSAESSCCHSSPWGDEMASRPFDPTRDKVQRDENKEETVCCSICGRRLAFPHASIVYKQRGLVKMFLCPFCLDASTNS